MGTTLQRRSIDLSAVRLPAAAIAMIVLGVAAASSASEKEAPTPKYQIGDWWLVRVPGDVRTRLQRVEIVRIEDGKVIMQQGPAKQEMAYDLELNKLEGSEPPSGRLVTYDPHTYHFDFPLEPGKEWGGDVKWSAPPYSGTFRVKAVAKDWEQVSLELGAGKRRGETEKLEALRIEYQHEDGGKVTKSTCWYSPKVRFAVRCESTDPLRSYEVADYRESLGKAAEPTPR